MRPAARVTDMHMCPMVTPAVPPIPHVGGPILPPGTLNVLIGGLPAATMGDLCFCVGPPDAIVMGAFNVLAGSRPIARMSDPTAHGGMIVAGCPTVLISQSSGGLGAISPKQFGSLALRCVQPDSFVDQAFAWLKKNFSLQGAKEKAGDASAGASLKVISGALLDEKDGLPAGLKVGTFDANVGIGVGKDGLQIGGSAELAVIAYEKKGVLAGGADLGLTGGVEGKALAVDGFAGYKDGTVGAKAEFTLWSIKGSTGLNILGYNISLFGEAGAKAGLGGSIGKKTELALGPFTIGISIGEAIDNEPAPPADSSGGLLP